MSRMSKDIWPAVWAPSSNIQMPLSLVMLRISFTGIRSPDEYSIWLRNTSLVRSLIAPSIFDRMSSRGSFDAIGSTRIFTPCRLWVK